MLNKIDMNKKPTILKDEFSEKYSVFEIHNFEIDLGNNNIIKRQLLKHSPVVVMLVHDVLDDKYILEKEYRVGSNSFANGLPAGCIDKGENVHQAALRELREETGIIPSSYRIEDIGSYYSSEGISDEFAHIMLIDLFNFKKENTDFDDDEYVEMRWVKFSDLLEENIKSSNSIIAIQYENIRRMKNAAEEK